MLEYLAMSLGNGSRIAVLGAGPAGSFFAMYLLQYAAAERKALHVDLYEWRSFSNKGPEGCNRCAGILSASLLKNLKGLDISVPEEVIRARISSYHLHSPFGVIHIANPDPTAAIFSVFRGGGPLLNATASLPSFDGFLLDCAVARGARLVNKRVRRVDVTTRPRVFLEEGPADYDLVVLANGLNSGGIQIAGVAYRPPATLTMAQDELHCRKEDIEQYFGNSVRAFLLPNSDLIFASIVPKGNFLNVSLLARGGAPDIDAFLKHDIVKNALPFPYKRSCGCRPRIAVGPSTNYYGDGFVAIGDAAVSRLYKDGIGSALLSARQAAMTAIRHGVYRHDFARHYAPFCRALNLDNRLGRIIFSLHGRTKDSSRFFRVQARLINAEGAKPFAGHIFGKVLWGMFTGSYTYRQILGMAANPIAAIRVAREYLRRGAAGNTAPTTISRPTNIVVLGGGFAGVYSVIRLEKALRRYPSVRISLVSDENFFLYTPLLHEVATGGVETRHIAYPIRKLRRSRRFDFTRARVTAVDLHQRRVATDNGTIDYDYLVLALGSTTNMTALPGASANVFTLKSLLDGVMIRNHIISMFEAADSEKDPRRRKQLLTFVVVGAGYTGVQIAADVWNFARRSLVKGYRSIDPALVRVLLVGDRDYILSGRDRRLSDTSARMLRKFGVDLRLNTRVTGLWDHGIEFNHAEVEPTDTVIWVAGIVASPVVSALPAQKDELGRVIVDQYLRVPDHPEVYALGDNAHFEDPLTKAVLPPRAHYAVRQPAIVAANILADLTGATLRSYRYQAAAELVSLGPRNAAMNLFGIHLSGLVARFIWLAGYLAIMMGPYNRTRVFIDWILGLIYDRDSTLLGLKR